MLEATPLRPPRLRVDLPNYPQLPQICRVYARVGGSGSSSSSPGGGSSGPNLYYAYVQQQIPGPSLRDREPCYVLEPNGVNLLLTSSSEYVFCRLTGAYPANDPASLPLFVTTCCGAGSGSGGSIYFPVTTSTGEIPSSILGFPTMTVAGPPTWTPIANTYPVIKDSNQVIWLWSGSVWTPVGPNASTSTSLSGNTNNFVVTPATNALFVTPTSSGFNLTGLLTTGFIGQRISVVNSSATNTFNITSGSGLSTKPFVTSSGSTLTVSPLQIGTFVYDGSQWIQESYSNPTSTGSIPSGTVADFAGSSVPSGWLECDGSTFSQAAFPDLATALGDTWGVHSGDNYFLPDLRDRGTIGTSPGSLGSLGSPGYRPTAQTLGTTGGYETHYHEVTAGAVVNNALGTLFMVGTTVGATHTVPTTDNTVGAPGLDNSFLPFAVVKKIIKT